MGGVCETWGLRNLSYGEIRSASGDLIEVTLDAELWYPGGAFEISTDKKYKAGWDNRKCLQTDATTKALSKLGFNADVFLGMFSDNKYVESLKNNNVEPEPPPQYRDRTNTEASLMMPLLVHYRDTIQWSMMNMISMRRGSGRGNAR